MKTLVAAFLLSTGLVAQAQPESPKPSANEIVVTARGIYMGRDIGKTDAVYSQRLGKFLVRNNIQGAEKFRDIACDGALYSLPQDAQSRENWIKNIVKDMDKRGSLQYRIDNQDGPVLGTSEEITAKVHNAVATRLFDGFGDAINYMNKQTEKFCPDVK